MTPRGRQPRGRVLAALVTPAVWTGRGVESAVESRPRPEIRGWAPASDADTDRPLRVEGGKVAAGGTDAA